MTTKINNKYNRNLVNQYKNEDLYEESLFDFILNNTDLVELKNSQFDISYQQATTVSGNFEAFLHKAIEYDYPVKKLMYQKIVEKYQNELLKPLYFISINKKEHVVEQAGYEIFKDINGYIRDLTKGKVKKLNDTEEKFVIDWFFKEPPTIYITKDDIQEVKQLYNILHNQKAYLNAKNDKSAINNFFENHGMKKIFSLFTVEQRNDLMNEPLSHKEIITSYYKKLLRQKHFDLSEQLVNFSAKEIVEQLKEQVSNVEKDWFKVFLEKGSGLSLSDLEKKLENKFFAISTKEKTKSSLALEGGMNLLKKILPEIHNDQIIKLIFVATIEAQNERYYLELRSFLDLPNDEQFRTYVNKKQIHKKTIDQIENEVLRLKLEDKYTTKEKTKQPKI